MNGTQLLLTISLIALPLLVALLFNTLIGRKNRVSYAFSSIDVMLKRRYDLIPNLVSTVEKYMTYERGVLDELTSARARAVSGSLPDDDRVVLENQLSRSLRKLFAVAENYPSLRASESFLHLQRSLNEVEEQVAAARRAYNAAVTDFNNGVEMFPLSLVAKCMGYRLKPWLDIPAEEREPVRVWR